MHHPSSVLPALIALLVAGTVAAQAPDPQRPTFRTGVDLVAVDVSVLDNDGRPVTGLTKEDFTVRVDGTARRLVSAEYIPLGAAARPRTSGVASRYFSTNAGAAGGRLIIFVVDRGNIRRGEGRPLLEAAGRFIGQLEPTDRIALAVIPDSGPYTDFTTDHRGIQRTISTQLGSAARSVGDYVIGLSEALAISRQDVRLRDEVVSRECKVAAMSAPVQARGSPNRAASQTAESLMKSCEMEVRAQAQLTYQMARQQTSSSLTALRNLLARLALSSGPKTMVLLSEGLFIDSRERGEFEQVAAAAAAADTTLYALGLESMDLDASVDRVSPTFNDDRVLRRQGLEMLVGLTRGRFYPVATGGKMAFDRIARELSGYYLLSFEPEGDDRDGQSHAIDVDVRRAGVEVRARRHFVAEPGATRASSEVLASVLRTPLPATELGMRVATFTFPADGARELRLIIAAEVEGAFAAGSLPCGFSLTDAAGNVVGAEVEGPAASAQPRGEAFSYMASFVMKPGQYTLKLAAVDDLGRRGSVEHRFDARLSPADQLQAGDLMLADPGQESGDVRPSIDGRMSDDGPIAYLELTSEVPSLLEAATVTFEVATSESSEALTRSPASVNSPTLRRRVAESRLETDLLPPGDYVARAVVLVNGRTASRIVRPFRLERPLASATATSASPGLRAGVPRLRGPAGIAGVNSFDVKRVLSPEVVTYFLDRLPAGAGAPLSPAAKSAAAAVRDGRFEEAARAVEAAEADTPTLFLRGMTRLSKGDFDGAAREFRAALKRSPDFFPAAFYLGACYAGGGRDEEAAGAWQTSLVTESEAPFVYELLGDALLRTDEPASAVDILKEARGLWPDDGRFVRPLAVAQAAARQPRDAIGTLEQHLEHHPDDAPAWLLGAWLVYDARLSRAPLGSLEEDLSRMARYQERYRSAGGRDRAIVEQWMDALKRP